jgi:hypothetical protein
MYLPGKLKKNHNPITGLQGPLRCQEYEAPRFQDNRHMKEVVLSALRTGRFYPPGKIYGTHFCWRLNRPQGHSAAGKIMSMKISMEPSGIESATFRLVAQCPNQLHQVSSRANFIYLDIL